MKKQLVTEPLVRSLHLNRLGATPGDSLGSLERSPWRGHTVVLGRRNNGWQDRDSVLEWFDTEEGEVREVHC